MQNAAAPVATRVEAEPAFSAGLMVDRDSPTPAYAQIEEQLADMIESGSLRVGDRLPSERDLARWAGVSRMTMRAALTSLADRGVLDRGVGRGTFVARPKVRHDLSRVAGFSEQLRRQGLAPRARIRALNETPAPETVARALEIEVGAPTCRIERLRLAGEQPLALEESWIPMERFPGLLEHDMRGSLYALMRDVYGKGPVRAVERLEPALARSHEAEALAVEPRSALMLVERIAYAAGDVPVEFAHDRHRGDRTNFVVHVLESIEEAGV
jgi:GntR family transcriptional regulator